MNYKYELIKLLNIADLTEADLGTPPELDMGDFSLACFKLAKHFKKPPALIAQEIASKIQPPKWLSKAEALNGYVNFFLSREDFASNTLAELANGFKPLNDGRGKTVCIDFSSVNIAKPFHMGHLPSTVIGGSLYKIFTYLGYKTIGINHLGDYGTQFGKLISVFMREGNIETVKQKGVSELQRLYAKYEDYEKSDPALIDEARAWSKKIEDGDGEACGLFELFKAITLDEAKKIYKRLNISFDSYNGESFFVDKVPAVVDSLKKKGLLTTSEGALVVDLKDYNMPPCLILRSDGASLYATRDIAAALYRKKEYNFDKCLYVVAYQQNLHFQQFFKVLELMGYAWAKDLEHVAFGMVSLEGGETLSSRRGNVVYLADVLDMAAKRTFEIMKEKGSRIDNLEETAQAIGVGAVVFGALSSSKIKDVTFSIDKVLNFDGETGPYLQYTHTRCISVLAKAAGAGICFGSSDCAGLDNTEAFSLIKDLYVFNDIVRDAAEKYEPCIVTKHLLSIAAKFNKFYFEHKIITDDAQVSRGRLNLVSAAAAALNTGLRLILIEPVEAM